MKGYILGHFIVAGVHFQEVPAKTWTALRRDDPLRLVRERYNPYDPLAIAVQSETGERLGYLPRKDNRIPAALLDQGAELTARIAEIRLHDRFPAELQVEVTLDGKTLQAGTARKHGSERKAPKS